MSLAGKEDVRSQSESGIDKLEQGSSSGLQQNFSTSFDVDE